MDQDELQIRKWDPHIERSTLCLTNSHRAHRGTLLRTTRLTLRFFMMDVGVLKIQRAERSVLKIPVLKVHQPTKNIP